MSDANDESGHYTFHIVLCVYGTVLMSSNSAAIKAFGAGISTFSFLRLLKKMAAPA